MRHNRRVLIVDDSVTIRAMLEQIFSNEPDLVIAGIVASAADVPAEMKRVFPDVLTLDLAMPGTDGMTLLSHLMQWCPIPIVILSSSSVQGSEVSQRARDLGASACFDKAHITRDAKSLVSTVRNARCGKIKTRH